VRLTDRPVRVDVASVDTRALASKVTRTTTLRSASVSSAEPTVVKSGSGFALSGDCRSTMTLPTPVPVVPVAMTFPTPSVTS
jgi:hypothetical protein